jgi:hypothetical protein
LLYDGGVEANSHGVYHGAFIAEVKATCGDILPDAVGEIVEDHLYLGYCVRLCVDITLGKNFNKTQVEGV